MPYTLAPYPTRSMTEAEFVAASEAYFASNAGLVAYINALELNVSLIALVDTSASSVAIGTGSKTFTVSSGKGFATGMYLMIASRANVANNMFCQVVTYTSTTLTVTCIDVKGSGTFTDWTITPMPFGGAARGVNNDITSMTAITQLQFPSTQVPSANVNTLDDYKEGTFTPTFALATPGTSAFTYSAQIGTYTKIGRQVFFHIHLTTLTASAGTGTGILNIVCTGGGGLPSPATTANLLYACNISFATGFTTNFANGGLFDNAASTIGLYYVSPTAATGNLNQSHIGGNMNIYLSGNYTAAN